MGSLNVFASGAWRKAKGAYVFAGGAWRKAKAVWVFTGGAWHKQSFTTEIIMTVARGNAFGVDSSGYYMAAGSGFGTISPSTPDVFQSTTGNGVICASPNFDPNGPHVLVLAGLVPNQEFNIEIVGFGSVNIPPAGPTDIIRSPQPGLLDFMRARVGQQVIFRFTYV